jgi:hypothetical protein
MTSKSRVRASRRTNRHREHSKRKTDWAVEVFEGPPLGPNVVSASVDEVMAAINALPSDLNWDDVADRLVPVFPRLRPPPPGAPDALRVVVPPGISLGFGIDAGPAFIAVDQLMVRRWGIEPELVLDRALANVDQLIAKTQPREVVRLVIENTPVAALQSSSGSASTYVLRPVALGRLLGDGDRLVMAPMRNLLLSMPSEVDRGFAVALFEDIALQDPNCLPPMAFLLRNGDVKLEPLGDPYGQA